MPSTSKKQARLMRIAAHSKKFAKQVGIDHEVAKEWHEEDKKLEKNGTASYEGRDDDDDLIDEALAFEESLESLYIQGVGLYRRGDITDDEIASFKQLSGKVLSGVELSLESADTFSGVDATTDLMLTLEYIGELTHRTHRLLARRVGATLTPSSESFQSLFGASAVSKPEASINTVTSVMVSPGADYSNMDADAKAIRWIEARRNLDCLAIMLRLVRGSGHLQGDEFSALKRLLKQMMTTTGFYLDSLDYANNIDALEAVMNEAKASIDTKISMTWKPGMPGYGIEGAASTDS